MVPIVNEENKEKYNKLLNDYVDSMSEIDVEELVNAVDNTDNLRLKKVIEDKVSSLKEENNLVNWYRHNLKKFKPSIKKIFDRVKGFAVLSTIAFLLIILYIAVLFPILAGVTIVCSILDIIELIKYNYKDSILKRREEEIQRAVSILEQELSNIDVKELENGLEEENKEPKNIVNEPYFGCEYCESLEIEGPRLVRTPNYNRRKNNK